MDDDKKYVASFFSFEYIANYSLEYAEYKKPGHGLYFWNKNMILINNCALDNIWFVVKELMDEGNFQEAFREL